MNYTLIGKAYLTDGGVIYFSFKTKNGMVLFAFSNGLIMHFPYSEYQWALAYNMKLL